MREVEGEIYLTPDEVKERYGIARSTLYLLREQGLLKTYSFVADRKSYWRASEIEALKNIPPKERPNPKELSVVLRNLTDSITSTGVTAPLLASI